MSDEYCNHGLIQLSKFGVDVDQRGVETCRGCGLPTWDSTRKARAAELPPVEPSSSRSVEDSGSPMMWFWVSVLIGLTVLVVAALAWFGYGASHSQ